MIVLILSIVLFPAVFSLKAQHLASSSQQSPSRPQSLPATLNPPVSAFCWRSVSLRQQGSPPSICSPGLQRGQNDCRQPCPQGFLDQYDICQKNAIIRKSYQRLTTDNKFDQDRAVISRCQADNGKGKCQKCSNKYYGLCPKGSIVLDCRFCKTPVQCGQYNMTKVPGNPLACKRQRKDQTICRKGQTFADGYCYLPCPLSSQTAVGKYCLAAIPNGKKVCGKRGAAKDDQTCKLFKYYNNDFDNKDLGDDENYGYPTC